MTTQPASSPGPIEAALRSNRDAGRKSFVPYLTGGLDADWTHSVSAVVDAGATAIEIGVPFSDPVMDGPTIQEANDRALSRGVTPASVFDDLRTLDTDVPMAVMTYYNVAFRMGHQRFAESLIGAGISGAILPDLPLEETTEWAEAADAAGVETILLAAPTAPDERLPRICDRSRGFVYGVGLVGITGERAELAASATEMARRLKDVTDKPVLVGVGVSTPEQAVQACEYADGVVVGSAIVRRMLEDGAVGVGELAGQFTSALNSVWS